MIAFDLQCCNGHKFEGWFEDSRAYDWQKEKQLIQCPVCNTVDIDKCLSAFAIKKAVSSQHLKNTHHHVNNPEEILSKLVDFVEKNFDDVGCDFTNEALKIHYGLSEPRNIRGVSSDEEEKTLKKEGINFFKLPMPPSSDSDA